MYDLVAYAGRPSSEKLLSLFAEGVPLSGSGDTVRFNRGTRIDSRGRGIFYGTDDETYTTLRAYRSTPRNYIYMDNAYVGPRRQYYRVTVDGLMAPDRETHPGAKSNGRRWAELHPRLRSWQRGGGHILIALQSTKYFDLVLGMDRNQWLGDVVRQIARNTDREIIIREKPTKDRPGPDLEAHLRDCHAIVGWNTRTTLDAILDGIPAFVLDPKCSWRTLALDDLSQIEAPYYPTNRDEVCGWLADNQWTVDEIRRGICWTSLHHYWR